jgi:hypothetical protein
MPIPAPSQVEICNGALDRARAGAINDINENSAQALKCRLHYPKVVSKLLESHEWSFANQRVQMAQAGTNDRPYEWLFAYKIPSNCAQPIRVLPDLASAGITLPQPLPGEPYSETWATLNYYEVPYEVLDGILYTNAENAWLDYTIADITGILVTRAFADAIEVELAYRLAISLKGDAGLKKDLATEKELMLQQAIAVDNNRQPQVWGEYLSESMVARHSGAISFPIDGEYP